MLQKQRRVSLSSLGALYSERTILHRSFRVDVIDAARIVVDGAVVARGPTATRSVALVLLEGEGSAVVGGRRVTISRGDVVIGRTARELSPRWEGARTRAVVIAWDAGSIGEQVWSTTSMQTSDAVLADIDNCAEAIASGRGDASALSLSMVSALARAGIPVAERAGEASPEVVLPRVVAMSRAIDDALSSLATKPMTIDLRGAMRLSSRQLQRELAGLPPWSREDAAGWRETLTKWRVAVGRMLMTCPGATTEGVSIALGYSSPTVLCRAFAHAKLPSPGAVGRSLLAA